MSEPHSPETSEFWTTAQADPILAPLLEAGIVSPPTYCQHGVPSQSIALCGRCSEPVIVTDHDGFHERMRHRGDQR